MSKVYVKNQNSYVIFSTDNFSKHSALKTIKNYYLKLTIEQYVDLLPEGQAAIAQPQEKLRINAITCPDQQNSFGYLLQSRQL